MQCRFSEASSCDELATEGARMQSLYDDALATLVSDAPEAVADARTTLDGAGLCMRQVVRAQLDRCEVDRCGALCAFEPCAIRAEDGGSAPASECVTRCKELVGSVSQPALDDAIVRAAANPGVCNCLACDAASAPLCDGLFRCEAAVAE